MTDIVEYLLLQGAHIEGALSQALKGDRDSDTVLIMDMLMRRGADIRAVMNEKQCWHFPHFQRLLSYVQERVQAYHAGVRAIPPMPMTCKLLGRSTAHPLFNSESMMGEITDHLSIQRLKEEHFYNNPSLLLFSTEESRQEQSAQLFEAMSGVWGGERVGGVLNAWLVACRE